MRDMSRKLFESSQNAPGRRSERGMAFRMEELHSEWPERPRPKNTQNCVMAVTDRNFFLGETSIVNIGSEGEYESSL
jgi:hypothetical protein